MSRLLLVVALAMPEFIEKVRDIVFLDFLLDLIIEDLGGFHFALFDMFRLPLSGLDHLVLGNRGSCGWEI